MLIGQPPFGHVRDAEPELRHLPQILNFFLLAVLNGFQALAHAHVAVAAGKVVPER